MIAEMGFESYFLIVWDFVRYAKENGIAVGPGRGSAAGSIVAYCLNITDLDPLANGLLFERFLNPARKSMPDIDIDFSVRGREQVIRYVGDKYGRESVAQIITFGKMAPRAATRDAARVLGFDYATGDRIAKQIPEPVMGRNPSFTDCLKDGEELKQTYESDPDARADPRRRAGAGGHRPQQLDPRRRRGDRGPAAGRDRAPAARRGSRRPGRAAARTASRSAPTRSSPSTRWGRSRRSGLLKMDFLGPAQPRRDRGRGRDHRALAGGRDRHRGDPARRREDLRDARARRLDRRLPVRVRRDARRAPPGAPDRVQRHRRARSPSTGRARCASSTTTRAASAIPPRSATRTRACARSPRRPTAAASTRSS